MLKRRGLLFSVVLFVVCIPVALFSYDEKTTHPGLTSEMIDLYNLSFPKRQISSEEREWVMQGSRDEDAWPRWINHFYDPIHNEGWTAEGFGIFSSSTGRWLSSVLVSDHPPIISKLWAESSAAQSAYKDFGGDRSWGRALAEYARGNKKEAFYTLGHILHLLEDATVPDHTRNDTHPHDLRYFTGDNGSPYELYTSRFHPVLFATNLPVTAVSLYAKGVRPIVLKTLASYFDTLATYSNTYFFSKDTVLVSRFLLPKIVKEDDVYGYGVDWDGVFFPLARKIVKYSLFRVPKTIFVLNDIVADAPILRNYFLRLSKLSIVYGAGAIELFMRQSGQAVSAPSVTNALPPVRSLYASLVSVENTVFGMKKVSTEIVNKGVQMFQPVTSSSVGLVLGEKVYNKVAENAAISAVPLLYFGGNGGGVEIGARQTTVSENSVTSSFVGFENLATSTVLINSEAGSESLGEMNSSTFVITDTSTAVVVSSSIIEENMRDSSSTSASFGTNSSTVINGESFGATTTPTALYENVHVSSSTQEQIEQDVSSSTVGVIAASSTFFAETTTTSPVVTSTVVRENAQEAPTHLIINEIAWSGTSADYPYDEWFELYNPTDEPIDFRGWSVRVDGNRMGAKLNNNIIQPHSYYLLEKMRDTAVRDVAADVIYDSVSFGDSGGEIVLFNPKGEVVDTVSFKTGWPAGDLMMRRSMERVAAHSSASDAGSWQSNQGQRVVPRTYNGGVIYGSPKQSNRGFIYLNGVEVANRVLTKNNSPYILGAYTIPANVEVVIEPGVVIKSLATYSKIEIYGSIKVGSEEGSSVVLTSGRDSSASDGVQIGTWSNGIPVSKDWQGLWFHAGSKGVISNTVIRFAGREFRSNPLLYTTNVSQAIRVESAELQLSHVDFSDNGDVHIYAEGSSALSVVNASFVHGDRAAVSMGGNVSMRNVTMSDFSNANGPVWFKNCWPDMANMFIEGNTADVVYVEASVVTSSINLSSDIVYYLNNMVIESGSVVTVDPGSLVYFAALSQVNVKGSLVVNGAEQKRIYMRSMRDGIYWGSIWINGGQGEFSNVVIEGGNYHYPKPAETQGMLMVTNSGTLNVQNAIIGERRGAGNTVYSDNSATVMKNVVIGQKERGEFHDNGIVINGGAASLDAVSLMNVEIGVKVISYPLPLITARDVVFENVDREMDPIGVFKLESAP